MNPSNNRMQVYIRAKHLTNDVKVRILEMGGSFTQRDTIGEEDHAITVWELAHFDAQEWEEVAAWMRDQGVDIRTEVLPPRKKRKKSR